MSYLSSSETSFSSSVVATAAAPAAVLCSSRVPFFLLERAKKRNERLGRFFVREATVVVLPKRQPALARSSRRVPRGTDAMSNRRPRFLLL